MSLALERKSIQSAVAGLKFPTDAFIEGKFVPAQSGKAFVTENPATGKPLANVAACESADVDAAVRSARKAFECGSWSRMAPLARKKVLLKYCDLLEAHADEIALMDCLEGGKPIGDCVNTDTPETIHCIRWHAELLDKIYDRVAPTGPENLALILREPLGVVGAVIPWNFPAQMAAWKIGPALAAGNSLILKPAEQTSLEAVSMANDTNYGLAASLYTRDVNTAHRVARAIRAGTVSVNCFSEGDMSTPFGGFKESGFAGRDKSIYAHEQYTELKTIWMALS